jgi:cytochrome c biogenesis protein CcmG, thiol:disulfide interchange protein DsbE
MRPRILLLVTALIAFGLPLRFAMAAEPAADFALPTLNDEAVQFSTLKGKVVYLDFWASWCAPCRKTFPWMNEMHRKYAAQGLQIVAINVDKNRADAEDFLKKIPAEFEIVLDPKRTTTKLYKVKGVPTAFIIDREGNIQSNHVGMAPEHFAVLEAEIKNLLSR